MRYKYLLISFLAFLPFWFALNLFSEQADGLWYLKEFANKASLSDAGTKESVELLKQAREDQLLTKNLENLPINAFSAAVIRIGSSGNKILLDKNIFSPQPPASLTKLMTAYVIYKLGNVYDPDVLVPVTSEAVRQEGVSGLKAGENYPAEVLLEKMLVESSNDSAFALAEFSGLDNFINLMNQTAIDIGLENTFFRNATGLDEDGAEQNFSSALDLARLAGRISKEYPLIFKITLNPLDNTNELLGEYPELIGGKTGWTDRKSVV